MIHLRRAALAALLLTGLAPIHRLRGQALPVSFADLQYSARLDATPLAALALGDSTKYPKTYWLEGALIGAIPLSLLAGTLAWGLCADPDNAGGGTEPCWDDGLLGFATGLGVGGSLGALIGGFIKKPKRKQEETIAEPSP